MDRAHLAKTKYKHHQTGPDMESTRQEKKGETKKHMEKILSGRHLRDGVHLERAGENCPGPRTLEKSCRWPMLREGGKGLKKERCTIQVIDPFSVPH